MENILISSFDLEVGGVERSLISMVDKFDYKKYNVDLMLYSHTGEFMKLLPKKPNLLDENKKYKTMRMSILDTIKIGQIPIAIGRLIARYKARGKGYMQMQYIWKYTLPYMSKLNKKYDVAISYLWPHYFVSEKVVANKKIAWIHTDYSTIETDVELDLKMWSKFDYIVAVSQECRASFISKYPTLKEKVRVIENITSPEFVRTQSSEKISDFPRNKGDFNILSVGRYCEAKGFDNAIKALRILHDRGYTNIKWYIIGYGSDEELLKKLVIENNLEESFILLGKKINPYPYMKECDLYAQPSRYEGKSVTVTEAQILGRPVMITNYATAKSQVDNGYDGYITELSIEGIADGIERLYRNINLREKFMNNCINTEYSNKEELKKLYEIM
ncbi:glycosyltransferase [Terrisporobacter petrolearius]|uniref:glycosyltransferase n=1 Tax=Terrisporobacter petrolearius TaxID=1460447 RepID=UPI001D16C017|nr:glycosyltransferase [Terrisporobacter petrolearius]MCC3865799.1 glycosyltransferase [Terrisporobacter petrolearius]